MSETAIESRHTLGYCGLCQTEMVICATCGNNSCNSGYGEVNGEECTDCPEAYAHQAAYWEGAKVNFAKKCSWSVSGELGGPLVFVRGKNEKRLSARQMASYVGDLEAQLAAATKRAEGAERERDRFRDKTYHADFWEEDSKGWQEALTAMTTDQPQASEQLPPASVEITIRSLVKRLDNLQTQLAAANQRAEVTEQERDEIQHKEIAASQAEFNAMRDDRDGWREDAKALAEALAVMAVGWVYEGGLRQGQGTIWQDANAALAAHQKLEEEASKC